MLRDITIAITEENTVYKYPNGGLGTIFVAWVYVPTMGDYGYLFRGDTEETALDKALAYVDSLEGEYLDIVTDENYYCSGKFAS